MKSLTNALFPKWILFTTISIIIFSACQKDIRQKNITNELRSKAVLSTPKAEHQNAQVAIDWYKLQLRMILNANPATNGAINSECFGYIGIGLYETVKAGIKNSVSLSKTLYQMPEMPQLDNNGYDLEVSANATLASLVRTLYPGLTNANKASIDSLENAYNEKFLLSMESTKFQRSQGYGRAVAAAVYNWSKTDNYNVGNAGYVIPSSPVGVWVPTPPAFGNPILPFIGNSRPLLIEDGSGVSPAPPFPYSELPSSDFYKMVKDIYDVSKILTTDQRNMALYWNDQGIGIGYTPQGHIMNVAIEAIEQSGVDLGTAAEAFAKSGIAIREAQLTCFRSKYQYNQIRPVSYIRKVMDPNWLPLIVTPPHPEFPAAHAYVTSATMRALASVLGDNFAVVDHTYDFRGFEPRPFSSLDEVGTESGNSRRYGGIHYLPSIITGLSEGRALGTRVGNVKLKE